MGTYGQFVSLAKKIGPFKRLQDQRAALARSSRPFSLVSLVPRPFRTSISAHSAQFELGL